MQNTILINDYPVSYVEQGDGPVLLFIHGSLADYRYWAPQVSGLSSRVHTIAMSLRHYWPEPWMGDGDGFTIEQHALDVATMIEEKVGGPVHLVGHSRGGTVAVQVALRFPHLLCSLVLADPALAFEALPSASGTLMDNAQQVGLSGPRAQAAELIRAGQLEAGLELFINTVSGDGVWQRLNPRRRQMPLDNAYTLLGQFLHGMAAIPLESLQRLHMPALLVNGERSADSYKSTTELLLRVLPNSTQVIIPAAAHAMSAENPRAFNAAVLDFLSMSAVLNSVPS